MIYPPRPPALPAPRQLPFVRRRYGVEYCTLCSFPIDYCACGTTSAEEAAQDDGDASGLTKRIAECQAGR